MHPYLVTSTISSLWNSCANLSDAWRQACNKWKKKPLQEIILLSGWCREARPEHRHLKSAGRGRPCTIMIGDGKICQRCKCPRYTIHVGGEGGGELSAALIWSLLPKQQNTKSHQTSQMCAVLSRITLQQPAVIYTWFNKGKQYTVVCNGAAHWHDTSRITGCRFASICALRWLQGFNELRVELLFFF